MKNNYIGIFDSGVGGLTVAKQIINILPNENIIYFGDTARVPYGSRSNKTILKYGLQDINFLKCEKLKIAVSACGTVSSIFLKNNISDFYFKDFFFTGVLEPTAKKAVETTKNNSIGIIGTKATIMSRAYEACINKLKSDVNFLSIPCPLFVPLVEERLTDKNNKIVQDIIDFYLSPLKNSNIDTLILGCTHYPLLYDAISKYLGKKVYLIDPGIETAKFIKYYLKENNLLNETGKNRKFFVSDGLDKFKNTIHTLIDDNLIDEINVIDINLVDK